jgi:N-acylneuraminate cytidylyltransferase/CMP-N,N'-diacetyllegionaminic acid synthase
MKRYILNPKILALIPARGGSKGLLKKNIRPLLGKPLIVWTIEEAKKSKYIDKIVVSTDDEEIARISRENGADVPFIRPKKLALDTSKTADVIIHAIDFFERQNELYSIIVLLEPTSPLRDAEDIDSCIQKLLDTPDAKAIVSVAKLESGHPEFNVVINPTGFIRKFNGSSNFNILRRQELQDTFFFDGSVYISWIQTFKERKSFYHELTLAYIIQKSKLMEIDDLSDFICIEALMDAKLKGIL